MKYISSKTIGLIAAAALALSLVACHQGGTTGSSQKIGVIDMQQLLAAPAVQHMGHSLMAKSAPAQAKLKAEYKKVMATRSAAQKAKGSAKTSLDAKLKTQEAAFASMMRNAQQAQAKSEHALQQKIKATIASVADDENVSYVYAKQAVLFGNTDDITDKVVHKLS